MSLDLGIFALLGILVPWGLLLLSRFPWTTTAVMALSTACTIGTGEFTGTVVATWLALFILLRARRPPRRLERHSRERRGEAALRTAATCGSIRSTSALRALPSALAGACSRTVHP